MARMPDNSTLCFRLFDLSLGGMGELLETIEPEGLVKGIRFAQAELNMGQWGMYHVDTQLISISKHEVIDSKSETIAIPRLNFRFLSVGLAVEWNPQRIIFSPGREAREKLNKVRE